MVKEKEDENEGKEKKKNDNGEQIKKNERKNLSRRHLRLSTPLDLIVIHFFFEFVAHSTEKIFQRFV